MVSSSMIVALVAAFSTAVLASPIEAREAPIAKCWINSDGPLQIPAGHVCTNAYTADGFEFGTQNVQLGKSYVTNSTGPTSGPWHCCYRCEQDPKCIGWQMNDDCSCQTWTATISCPPAPGTFGHSATAFQNVTGIYHPSNSQCNA